MTNITVDNETKLARVPAGKYDLIYQRTSDEWHVVPADAPLRSSVDGDHAFLGWFFPESLEWWSNHGQPEVPEEDVEHLRGILKAPAIKTFSEKVREW